MADFDSAPDDFGSYGGGPAAAAAPQSERYLHPVAALFHVLFKVIALVVYCVLTLVPGISGQSLSFSFIFFFFFFFFSLISVFLQGMDNLFIIVFIVTVLLAAADFWTVKNVTGRLMVGLRWWNEIIPETGESKWSFESKSDRTTIHKGGSFALCSVALLTNNNNRRVDAVLGWIHFVGSGVVRVCLEEHFQRWVKKKKLFLFVVVFLFF
jgi:hypothetical protein